MSLRAFVDRFLECPAVYTAWQAPFAEAKFAPVARYLDAMPVRRVLDVGCGPGTNAGRFVGAPYTGIDINEHYLTVARSRYPGTFICADLATADLTSLGQFDLILVNSFLHHLPDEGVHSVLRQIPALLSDDGRLHILELVRPRHPSLARMMAKLDRGRYARSIEQWVQLFSPHFDSVVLEPYMLGGGLWAMLYFQGAVKRCVSP